MILVHYSSSLQEQDNVQNVTLFIQSVTTDAHYWNGVWFKRGVHFTLKTQKVTAKQQGPETFALALELSVLCWCLLQCSHQDFASGSPRAPSSEK